VSDRVVIRISEAEAVREFVSLVERVSAGAEVVIQRDAGLEAEIRCAAPFAV
jgi:hypothetical protein